MKLTLARFDIQDFFDIHYSRAPAKFCFSCSWLAGLQEFVYMPFDAAGAIALAPG